MILGASPSRQNASWEESGDIKASLVVGVRKDFWAIDKRGDTESEHVKEKSCDGRKGAKPREGKRGRIRRDVLRYMRVLVEEITREAQPHTPMEDDVETKDGGGSPHVKIIDPPVFVIFLPSCVVSLRGRMAMMSYTAVMWHL